MISRRRVLAAIASGLATRSVSGNLFAHSIPADPAVLRIAFGSCVSQRKVQHIWASILEHRPQAFVLMGDGVYPEHEGVGMPVLEQIEAAYAQAARRTELKAFRENVPVIATWDDNDYGGSDIGASFEHKQSSRDLFLQFWADPDERNERNRDSGIYGAWEFGSDTRRTQIILLDLRYSRSEWAHTEAGYLETLRASGFGPYSSSEDADVTMLGDEQWKWLECCLRRPARLRILVSSIQCVPEGRGWESWSNFPAEKARLLRLIRSTGAEGLVILSGDTHYAEISRLQAEAVGYPLWEITSSGLTEQWPTPGPNAHRVGAAYPRPNYGLMHVNWVSKPPLIVFEIYSDAGVLLRQQSITLDSLYFDDQGQAREP